MKSLKLLSAFIIFSLFACSKSDDVTQTQQPVATLPAPAPIPTPVVVNVTNLTTTVPVFNFAYKTYYQTPANANNRKGLIILAHGDGSSSSDTTINDQCAALANMGYVAVTTSYRPFVDTYNNHYNTFKGDMEKVIQDLTALYNIPVANVTLGGLSRGGNLAINMFLPADAGAAIQPTTLNLKGAILMCAGGDTWKGTNFKKPVLYMNNAVDPTVGVTDANLFKNGLLNNVNPNVATLSKCLIVAGSGHCTGADQYKIHITNNINSFY